jgi:signal transduction histidine kinase
MPNRPPKPPTNISAPTSADEASELNERLAFLDLTAADADHLRSLRGVFDPKMKEFVELFYRHLFAFERTARFLRDPELVKRLKKSQESHFESMLDAEWDEEYVQRRRRVGDMHAMVGIEPQIFLGAYNQYLQFCFRSLSEQMPGIPPEYFARIGPLLKAVILDVGLTLDAYFHQATQALRSALDMLLQANTELRQFAQFTSHDLKTPLATVINLCDEALDEFGGQLPAEARRLVESARNQSFRMSETIDELLSTTTTIRSDEPVEEVSSQVALNQAIERARPLLEANEIEVKVPSQLPLVSGDQIRLREAFYNLLSNAAKFIDKRPGRITVSVRSRGNEHTFFVADNGPGIPPEELDRIFVPFRRLAMHREKPGSGLGLYFTKSLIEQQGGRIWVESDLGKGSRFIFALKRAGT